MLRNFVIILLLGAFLVVAGCEDDDEIVDPVPQPPQGVTSVTGDSEIYLWWYGPYDRDIAEFIIYRNDDGPNDPYVEISRRSADDNPNLDLIIYSDTDRTAQNNVTYWYAVASVDHAGQISELSAENVFDTPRDEGVVSMFDWVVNENASGFNFMAMSTVTAFSAACDVYIDRDQNGLFYINAAYLEEDPPDIFFVPKGFIQDLGYTDQFDEIGWAPQVGWSELNFFEIIEGHTYVILTDEDRYAKMRVTDINSATGRVDFQWAFQRDTGNPELIAPYKNENDKLDRIDAKKIESLKADKHKALK